MNSIKKSQDRFHGKIEWSDGRKMTQKEKDIWLDQKIKTGIKEVYWTERWKKYYAIIRIEYETHFLGEFDTANQAIEARMKAERFYGLRHFIISPPHQKKGEKIKMKIMVDQKLVKKLLASGLKSYTIEKIHKIPRSVTEDIATGKPRLFYHKKVKTDKTDMCECCGFRKKHHGFRKLCIVCFNHYSEDKTMDAPQSVNL